jgi:hypothetical protein
MEQRFKLKQPGSSIHTLELPPNSDFHHGWLIGEAQEKCDESKDDGQALNKCDLPFLFPSGFKPKAPLLHCL